MFRENFNNIIIQEHSWLRTSIGYKYCGNKITIAIYFLTNILRYRFRVGHGSAIKQILLASHDDGDKYAGAKDFEFRVRTFIRLCIPTTRLSVSSDLA